MLGRLNFLFYIQCGYFKEEYNMIRLWLKKTVMAILWKIGLVWEDYRQNNHFTLLLFPWSMLFLVFQVIIFTWLSSYLSCNYCWFLLLFLLTLEPYLFPHTLNVWFLHLTSYLFISFHSLVLSTIYTLTISHIYYQRDLFFEF